MNWQLAVELAAFVVAIAGSMWNAAHTRGRSEALEIELGRRISENTKKLDEVKTETRVSIDDFWKWKQRHEEDAEKKRREFDAELTTLKVTVARSDVQNVEILRRLDNIEVLLKEELKKKSI